MITHTSSTTADIIMELTLPKNPFYDLGLSIHSYI